jgi:hypothetical protein
MLNKQQKIEIIKSRISILEGVLYNLDLALIEEAAKTNPVAEYLNELNNEKSENNLALTAMNNELNIVLSSKE